jgi:hypothetical protein
VYDFYYILYIITGLIAFGNTCLFIALIMSIEDKKTERNRPQQKTKKRKKIAKKKKDLEGENQGWLEVEDEDGNIIIEEI